MDSAFEDKITVLLDKLPSLPVSVTKVVEISNNPNATATELNKVISLDPVLTGSVLKLINSAYFMMAEQVTSISKSIIMLGIITVKNLAISTAVVPIANNMMQTKIPLPMEGFWKHCLAVGATAKHIAKKINFEKKFLEEFFICGLLHDIGKLVLQQAAGERYYTVIKVADGDNKRLIDVESEILGVNHSEVGSMLCKKWQLGQNIQDVISMHHFVDNTLPDQSKTLIYAVHLANVYCNLNNIGFSGDISPGKVSEKAIKELGIGLSDLFDVEDVLNKEINNASVFLKIHKDV